MNNGYSVIWTEYVRWLDTLGFSNGLIYDYKGRVKDFIEWLELQQINHIKTLTQKHIHAYNEHLQSRQNKRRKGGLGTSHLNHNFMALDKFCEFLHQIGMDTAPIPINLRIKTDKNERIYKIETLSKEEIKTLQDSIINTYERLTFIEREAKQEQLKLVFALFYGCGIRRTEGANLQIDDIDFEKKTIFIRQGKNYKDRIIPMSTGVYKALENYIYNFRNSKKLKHKRLFIHSIGTVSDSLKELQNTCENETIKSKRITLHILRHSIATHLLQNGMSIENIALFLGHSSLESTQIYTHLIEQ
ncbi:MAG: tyrosine-type recombinase/integrase [Chitinophagales bacterium]|jgi:integrase/recombinase XerD